MLLQTSASINWLRLYFSCFHVFLIDCVVEEGKVSAVEAPRPFFSAVYACLLYMHMTGTSASLLLDVPIYTVLYCTTVLRLYSK